MQLHFSWAIDSTDERATHSPQSGALYPGPSRGLAMMFSRGPLTCIRRRRPGGRTPAKRRSTNGGRALIFFRGFVAGAVDACQRRAWAQVGRPARAAPRYPSRRPKEHVSSTAQARKGHRPAACAVGSPRNRPRENRRHHRRGGDVPTRASEAWRALQHPHRQPTPPGSQWQRPARAVGTVLMRRPQALRLLPA